MIHWYYYYLRKLLIVILLNTLFSLFIGFCVNISHYSKLYIFYVYYFFFLITQFHEQYMGLVFLFGICCACFSNQNLEASRIYSHQFSSNYASVKIRNHSSLFIKQDAWGWAYKFSLGHQRLRKVSRFKCDE